MASGPGNSDWKGRAGSDVTVGTDADGVGAHGVDPVDVDAEELALATVMLGALNRHGLTEIERALRLTLFEPPSPMERRHDELHCLARMLDAEADRRGLIAPGRMRRFGEPLDDDELDAFVHASFPRVAAADYDAERPAEAPSSKQLTARFGNSWPRTCRAVWGLMADGRYAGMGLPWQNVTPAGCASATRKRSASPRCVRARVAALRACARRFGIIPSVSLYLRWVKRRNAHARGIGAELPRLPNYQSFNLRWGGWPGAIKAAEIREEDLRAGSRLRALPGEGQFTPEPQVQGPSGSVLELTAEGMRRARLDRGISESALRAAAGLTLSEWRRFNRGDLQLAPATRSALRGVLT